MAREQQVSRTGIHETAINLDLTFARVLDIDLVHHCRVQQGLPAARRHRGAVSLQKDKSSGIELEMTRVQALDSSAL